MGICRKKEKKARREAGEEGRAPRPHYSERQFRPKEFILHVTEVETSVH